MSTAVPKSETGHLRGPSGRSLTDRRKRGPSVVRQNTDVTCPAATRGATAGETTRLRGCMRRPGAAVERFDVEVVAMGDNPQG